MATPRTRNLRLFLSSGLTTEAKANLEIIDRLGDVYYVDSTDAINLRSKTDIYLRPADPNVGGSGKSDVYIGTASVPLSAFRVFADDFVMRGTLRIYDVAPGGTQHLILRYKSGLVEESSANTEADRELQIDLGAGDRKLILNNDVSFYGPFSVQFNSDTNGPSQVVLPPTGVLATLAREETLSNKTLISPTITSPLGITKADVGLDQVDNTSDATKATLSQTLTNKSMSGTANYFSDIPYESLNLAGKIKRTDIQDLAGIEYEKLDLTSKIRNADIAPNADINATKIKVTPSGNLASINLQSALVELQSDVDTRTPLISFNQHQDSDVGHGTLTAVVGVEDSQTLKNKTIRANENTIRNITNFEIDTDAAIAYSKLDLFDRIKNADISDLLVDRIEGRKILAEFQSQPVSTYESVKIGGLDPETALPKQIELAPPSGGFESAYTLKFPPTQAQAENQVLAADGQGGLKWYATAGSGTVTSVAMTVPAELLALSGSPIETTGTLAVSLQNQSPNTVFAGPATGLSNSPTFRALTPADLPAARDITDFAEDVQDAVADLVQDSSSILWTYDDDGAPATLSAAVSLASFNTGNLTEGSRLYYTDERVYLKAKALLQGSTTLSVVADDVAQTLTLSVIESAISTDNITEGSTNLFFTDERAQDAVANLIVNSSDIGKSYNDESNSFTLNLLKTAITSKTEVSPDPLDHLLISDENDSGNLKKVKVQDLVNLSGGAFSYDWETSDGAGPLSLTHNLGSKDVIIQIYDKTDGDTVWISSMKRDTLNTVELTASEAPPAGGWRVLIKRI